MQDIIYFLNIVILFAGTSTSGKLLTGSEVYKPRYPMLLNIASLNTGILLFGMFIFGFFIFEWYIPLLSMIIGIIISAYQTAYLLHNNFIPGILLMECFLGICISIYIFIINF